MTEPPAGWSAPDERATEPTSPTSAPTWTNPVAPPPTGAMGYGPGYGSGWGAPQPGVVPLRPLGVGELLDGAIKILRRYPRPTLGLAAAIAAVVTVVNVLLVLALRSADDLSAQSSDGTDFTAGFSVGAASSGPGSIVSLLAGVVLTGALVTVVGKAILGQQVLAGDIWPTVRRRLWALLGLALLTGLLVIAPVLIAILLTVLLAVTAGSVALVGFLLVPLGLAATVYLYTRLALAPAALVLEKAGVTTALRRSGVLVRGAWWRTFWLLLLTAVIGGAIGAVLALPLGLLALLAGSHGSTGFLVAQQVAAGLASVLVSPFTAGVHALIYVDRRIRAEGLDVSLAAAAAGAPAP